MKNMKEINFSNYCVNKDGEIYSLISKRLMKTFKSIDKAGGYIVVGLIDDSGKKKTCKVHRLVALTFLPKVEGKDQVNHKDGNKLNNSLSNLEWVTAKENSLHAHRNGLYDKYNHHPNALIPSKEDFITCNNKEGRKIYNSDDVHNICYHLQEGYRICDTARMLGINVEVVKRIKKNGVPSYSEIVSQYNFDHLVKHESTNPEVVLSVCKMLEKGKNCYEIGRELSIDRKIVSNIKNRKTHRNLSCDYSW